MHKMGNGRDDCTIKDGHKGGHRSAKGALKHKATVRAWQLKNRGIVGMTPERFEQMKKDQNNECGICREPFIKTPDVDHDHSITDSDNVRELLCHKCNLRVGQFEHPLAAETMAYIERWKR